MLREQFGVSNAEPARWWAIHRSTDAPEAADRLPLRGNRLRGWLRRFSTAGLAGGGDGQPRWPAEPAGRSTTSASRRLWREEGLRVPPAPARKKRLTRLGVAVGAMFTDVRTYLGDGLPVRQTADGRTLKMLN